jgi:3-methylfumaryl-CoA hydratase
MNPIDDRLRGWLGRQQRESDEISAAQVALYAATLDRAEPLPASGDELPPLWHWLHFRPAARQSAIGPDGHPQRGEFLPPVPLPRRMWAGGHVRFLQPLRVGEAVSRLSTIADISGKHGRTTSLVFVRVRHEIHGERGLAISEDQDIVYRDEPAAGQQDVPGERAASGEQFARGVVPDPVLLFRWSAITFNSHRIHYDLPYATAVEHYPGLVVQGPLVATMLADLLRRQDISRALKDFRYRALRPLFCGRPFTLCGTVGQGAEPSATLWTRDDGGFVTMQATALLG